MSNLAEKTERKALVVLAKAVLLFEELRNVDMTAADAFDVRQAENLLRVVIENNGCRVVCHQGKKNVIQLPTLQEKHLKTNRILEDGTPQHGSAGLPLSLLSLPRAWEAAATQWQQLG